MGMLLDMFPSAQFLVTGAAGPGNCMHAPNENLHIDYSARLTMCVSQVVATLATTAVGEEPPADTAVRPTKRSFIDAFNQSGGNSKYFVGCDCGMSGCVIFDQGLESNRSVCPPCPPAI
mmetsp:Transcript_10783/g.21883  ORF Transcript_10783/g.21883 Transcript_10783/m.21883 type:complete len:119 (-) Transcript_10783:38-394(-)